MFILPSPRDWSFDDSFQPPENPSSIIYGQISHQGWKRFNAIWNVPSSKIGGEAGGVFHKHPDIWVPLLKSNSGGLRYSRSAAVDM